MSGETVCIEHEHWTEYRRNGLLHREDGPALIVRNTRDEWWVNGVRHRHGAPAVEYVNGDYMYFRKGELHREDGPAMVFVNLVHYWYKRGKLHRIGGPAVVSQSEMYTDQWWIEGKQMTREEFDEYIRGEESWKRS